MSWPYWVLAIYLIGVGLTALTALDDLQKEDSELKADLNKQMDEAIGEDPSLEMANRNVVAGVVVCVTALAWPSSAVTWVWSKIKGLLTKSR